MGASRLGRVQFRIMQVLWDRGQATARDVTDALNKDSFVAHSTVQTLLRQLEDKGAVAHRSEGRTFVYWPLLDEESMTRSTTRDLIERVFGGSAVGLMAHLLKEERLSRQEIEGLRRLIDEQNKYRGHQNGTR